MQQVLRPSVAPQKVNLKGGGARRKIACAGQKGAGFCHLDLWCFPVVDLYTW